MVTFVERDVNIYTFVAVKFFPLFLYQPEKVALGCALIGNRVQITNCRATVSNTKGFTSYVHC